MDHGDKKTECSCKLRERAINYLTPMYASAQYTKTFDASRIVGKNLYLPPDTNLKSFVKSFLLNTGMVFTHKTVSAYDVLQAYLTNVTDSEFYGLREVDILILYLVQDPSNKSYGQIISSLIQSRTMMQKATWVHSKLPKDSVAFSNMYGLELVEALKNNSFISLR